MAAPHLVHPTTISKPRSNTTDASRPGATRTAFLVALALILFAPSTVTAAGVREDHPNLVGGELLGRGLILTVNYERFLTNHLGLGGGIGVGAITSLYVSFLTGDTRSLYLSAGGAFIPGGLVFDSDPALIMQGSVGYQFQSPGGFFVRPLLTLNQRVAGEGKFRVWPGLTIGGSF